MLITSRTRNIRTGESVVHGFQNDENGRSQMIPALQTKDGKIHEFAIPGVDDGFESAKQLVAIWRARGDAITFA